MTTNQATYNFIDYLLSDCYNVKLNGRWIEFTFKNRYDFGIAINIEMNPIEWVFYYEEVLTICNYFGCDSNKAKIYISQWVFKKLANENNWI